MTCLRRVFPLTLGLWLALLASVEVVRAQQTGSVRGSVTAEGTLEPLAGAQVSIPGTGRGSLTNAQGDYMIVGVPVGQHTVRVQMIGYDAAEQSVTVAEGQPTTADFQLSQGVIALEELVVTGAGVVQQKRSLGQSVATVDADEFETAPINNVTDALSGRVPGLVANAAGETGQGAPIRLRGTVSLSQRNGPLIYVDGVRVDNNMDSPLSAGGSGGAMATNRLNDLNPNNIARVEVLKGAAAATLFGTEASAGVIQIFTKRGTEGPPQWEFSTTQQVMDTPDRIPPNFAYDAETGQVMTNDPSQDFVDLGHRQEYFLSVRGGSESAQYFGSGWWTDEAGTFPTNSLSNMGVNMRLDFTPAERLQTQFNVELIQNELRAPYPTWGLIGEFTLADPSRVTEARPYGELFHTVAGALAYENTEATDRYTVSGTARYQWFEGLLSSATVGYNTTQQQNIIFVEYGIDPRNIQGQRQIADTRRENITLDFSTAWEQQLTSSFASTLTVGAQSFWENSSSNLVGVVDYPSSGLETLRGANVDVVTEDFTEVINAGLFAQEQLAINNRIFLTAGVRVDGNSAFGDDFGFQTYPKAGVSWVISDEPFWNIGLFDQLRLRAAYGTSGLQPGAYDALRTWRAYSRLSNIPILLPYAVGNEELKPERSTEFEFGADLAMFDNRFGAELVYFSQRTSDAILNRPLPPSQGFLEEQVINIGELESQGFEAALDLTALESESLRLNLGATLALIDQNVVDMGGVQPIRTSTDTRRWNYIREGYQPGAVLAPKLDANDPYRTTAPIENVTSLSQIVPNTIKDASGSDSLVYIGDQLPTTTGTLSGTLDFPNQGLSLRAMLRGERGYVMLDQTGLIRTQVFVTEEVAQMAAALDNPATSAAERQAIAERYARIHPGVHSNWVHDAENVRLQEVALTWRVPTRFGAGLGLENTSVTLAGRNLFLWTPYPGIGDPGATSTPTADFNQNIDYFSAPAPRRFEITVRTGF